MASYSSSEVRKKQPAYFMCPICRDHLQKYTLIKRTFVNLSCGHVYHEQCWQTWSKTRNAQKREGQAWEYECLLCKRVKNTNCAKRLYLDAHEDLDYVEVRNSNKRLRLDNQVLKQGLEEIKIRLLAINHDNVELRQRLEKIKWEDLTELFKDELLSKLKTNCPMLKIESRELSFLRPNTLFELIRTDSNENLLILKFSEDLYDDQTSLNGTTSLDDFKQYLNIELVECLRKACNVPTLDLRQLPVSPRILHLLLTTTQEKMVDDRSIIMKILETFLCADFGRHTRELLTITLVNLIISQVHFEFGMAIPLLNESLLSFLVTCKILKLENKVFVFRHDSVRFFFLGLIISIVKKNLDLSLSDACLYICESRSGYRTLDDYIIGNLNKVEEFVSNTWELDTDEFTTAFKFTDTNQMDLFVILAILKVKKAKLFIEIFQKLKKNYKSVARSILEVRIPCKIDSCVIDLNLPEFAAIRGEYSVMKTVYEFFCLSNRSKYFEIRKLVQLCANWTLNQNDTEILERSRMISFILSLKECRHQMISHTSKATSLTVNKILLKTVVEKGLNYFINVWDVEHIFREVFPNVDEDEAAKLAFALIDPSKMMKLLDLYVCYRPITV